MDPFISVIIPCFNHGCCLGEAICSVLGQTYSNVEIIVVDDGSTDDTAQVTQSFGSSVRYVWQENRGLAAARNAGIQIARGTFLSFLDADDCFYPDKIEKQLKIFERDSSLGLVYCGWHLVRDGDFFLLKTEVPGEGHDFVDALLTHSLFHVLCPLVRRDVIERTGFFDESLASCEDRDYWLRAARKGIRFGCVAEVLAWVRVREGSMNTDVQRMYGNRLAVFEKHCDALADPNAISGKRARIHFQACVEHLRKGNRRAAATCLQKALLEKDDLLERCSTWESALIGIAGDPYWRNVEPGPAEAALARLLDLSGSYVSASKRKRQAFYGQMSLGRISAANGDREQCRRAYRRATLLALQVPVPFGRLREVLSAAFFARLPERPCIREREHEVCLPPSRTPVSLIHANNDRAKLGQLIDSRN